MRNPLLIALALVSSTVMGACSAFEPDKAVVPDSTLVEILVDLHVAGARERLGFEGSEGIRDSILVRHRVDEAAFRESIGYYAEHPDEYLALYRDVLDRIVREQSGLGNWLRQHGEPDTTGSPVAD